MLRTIVSLSLLVLGCSAADAAPPGSLAAEAGPAAHLGAPRELAIHVALALEVDDVRTAYRHARALVAQHDGWIARGSDGAGGASSLDARIPRPRLAAFRAAIAGLGAVESDREGVEDLTDAHVDLSARIRSARAAEERLLALLADRTASLADVLTAERELARVRESIERLESQERAISARVEAARVEITLHAPPPVPAMAFDEDPIGSIAGAFEGGARSTRAFLVAAAMTIAAISPSLGVMLTVGAPLLLAVRALRRRVA